MIAISALVTIARVPQDLDLQMVHAVFVPLSFAGDRASLRFPGHGLQPQIVAAIAHGLAEPTMRERMIHADSDGELWSALGDAVRSRTLTRVGAG